MGHLNEALPIIEDILNNAVLSQVIVQCSVHAQECFTALTDCLKGKKNNAKFVANLGIVRHKTVFHYDDKLVRKAITYRARTKKSVRITISDDVREARFELADTIQDTIACRQIWKAVGADPVSSEIDGALTFGYQLFLALLDFTMGFVMRYMAQYAAI